MKKRQRKTQILHQNKLHKLFEKRIQQCEGVLDQNQSTIDKDDIILSSDTYICILIQTQFETSKLVGVDFIPH